MGSSQKKKNEKKKDFQVCLPNIKTLLAWALFLLSPRTIANYDIQKPKLKVGKARPKAANVTDTSFRSKGMFSSFVHIYEGTNLRTHI